MVTDAELIFWCVCGAIVLVGALALPGIVRYLEQKDYERSLDYSDKL